MVVRTDCAVLWREQALVHGNEAARLIDPVVGWLGHDRIHSHSVLAAEAAVVVEVVVAVVP